MIHDFIVIGGGIVGLATARELLATHPGAAVAVLEKEDGPARHQTGHNSGVIHAGIYYKPGSLKAQLCREGAQATKDFCTEHGIPFETRGKLVVATNPLELQRMVQLRENAAANGIHVETLDATELKRREPNVAGIGALFVAESGIVDYRQVCVALAEDIRRAGGELTYGVQVEAIAETGNAVTVSGGGKSWQAKRLIVCGGLQSDRLARMAGLSIDYQVVPFRGEYYALPESRRNLVRHLIYPVPDPSLPFLGIHLTPMIDGALTLGPNAVLGFAREGYPRLSVNLSDVWSYVTFPGFWRVMRKNWRSGLSEGRNSLFRSRYLEECRKYCPDLTLDDLLPREAGIRAQAVLRDGTLVHDFLFVETARMLHVCNAPSPAATSVLPIARMIARRATGAINT
ncbi:L-2-hydroxyglutarate oxidase [Pseudoxanthobacter soli DSM 19599]|uniref:L-2-hydroxyglutarate oxidase n=1 Tax=Pseudoxanthobacter soli DSM 19599 TaxID=1123029 RepID=A0A1M7ZNP8_9HYPH|nr:L-2-hydroxyglutarate oxidase [Pseudoxanthobacter soli DSM 19599]